ncbi:uncharacterized protein BDZ83DRAFT_653968 [Colletotrichum acutatum]|uniref:Uncharacterized protein n=1 Tax=Glomerella acutata TaxID=27357 RepID=A0AAD8UEE0_GLOAC|nr:uncharacterized protein BDZ83DRAFT_653968 [Colletotrichum acutatum]KAK1722376.1 hypothetical protein BDZ83DRAFT_653968 [Colletotrichum acutatum]
MEVSIRRVLSSSPQYAEAIVVAFDRRLRGLTSQNHDAPDLPVFLTSLFQRLHDHSECEAVDNESSSAGKRTTDNGARSRTSSTVIPAGSVVPSQTPVSLKREREKDEKDPQKTSKSKKPCHIVTCDNIEKVANEADKKRPKQGTEASFEKQLGIFRAVWGILFPDAGSGPKSPCPRSQTWSRISSLPPLQT